MSDTNQPAETNVPEPNEPASKELTEYVGGVAAKYSVFVNADAGLTSLLYDVDLLPEQLIHVLHVNPPAAHANALRMSAICELWRCRDEAKFAEVFG